MNEPEKLTIRINFRPEKDRAPEEQSRCNYHWRRIIAVSLAVIVAIASLISAGSYYLNQDQIDSEYVKSATNKVADKSIASPALMPPSSLKKDAVRTAEPSPAETDTVPEEVSVIKPVAADTASEEVSVIKLAAADTVSDEVSVIKPVAADTVSEEVSVIKPVAADTVSDEVSVIKPAADTVSEEISVIKPVAADTVSDEVSVIKPAVADKNTVSQLLFTQSQKNILSDNITRFVISQAVEGNEPIGTISDIHFDANNIATVYAYSDVNALKDQTLYYQWSLDGKNIAKIRVDVGSNRWRSYSSKFIQPHMHGEWKVELQNQTGKNLAINQFHY